MLLTFDDPNYLEDPGVLALNGFLIMPFSGYDICYVPVGCYIQGIVSRLYTLW
jgi:hypothetical protein